jgi:two-component system, OmpR family, sensor histidine kinase ArlS
MMQKIRSWIAHLPIKWKMVLWSSLTLFLIFAAYNVVQYITINQWVVKEEKSSIQRSMAGLQDYFQEKKENLDEQGIVNSRSFLETMNERNQLIRILDSAGNPIVTVADRLPADYVTARAVEQTQLLSTWHREDHLLVMRSPLIAGPFHGTIEIVNNVDTFEHLTDMIIWVMITAGLGAVLLSGLGGLILVRQLLKPVHSLTETIQNVKKRGLHERVQHSGTKDEFSRLASLFNDLLSQLETSFKQQKQFVEDASHELRTPISIIKGHLSLLNRWGKNDPQILEKSLSVSIQEFDRLEGIVQELLELTRAENELLTPSREGIQPVECIQQTVNRFMLLHPNVDYNLEINSINEGSRISVAPHQLEQVVLILLDNAIKYSDERPSVRIVGEQHATFISIEVIDRGIGIPEEDLPQVFDRFYRVDKARSREKGGTGLGLAIAKRLVENNGGEISITSVEHEGTRVRLMFPLI